jgi:hypothetical protein
MSNIESKEIDWSPEKVEVLLNSRGFQNDSWLKLRIWTQKNMKNTIKTALFAGNKLLVKIRKDINMECA